jgi:hypothetical protein
MSKPKPSKVSSSKEPGAKSRWNLAAAMLHLLGILIFVGGMVYLVDVTKKYVEQEAIGPVGPLRIALVNKPVWMSDYLAEQIADTIPKNSGSAFDHDLLVQTVARLKKNPWVAEVKQVRRVYGEKPGDTLEVDCEYRAPVALVKWGQAYWLVDNDGYLLPEKYTDSNLEKIMVGRDNKTTIRVIDGVRQPPPESGRRWAGADLAAGLDLVKLFYGKLFLDEVTAVDVTNFGGRVRRSDPQLVLETRYGTQVWWGRPLNTKDFFVEVSATRKLEILRAVVQKDGRIDANRTYLDVRYDNLLVPTTLPSEARTVDDPNR